MNETAKEITSDSVNTETKVKVKSEDAGIIKTLWDMGIQFFKFGLIGVLNTGISYTITNVGFYVFKINPQISNLLAFAITVLISFALNNRYVFNQDEKKEEKKEKKKILKPLLKVYVSYSVTGIFLTGILIYVGEDILGIEHYLVTLGGIVVSVPINFMLNKFWAYKK